MAECNQCFVMSDGTIKRCYECLEKKYIELKDIVQISCNPPDDCNDPVVLKNYMKACFEEAMRI